MAASENTFDGSAAFPVSIGEESPLSKAGLKDEKHFSCSNDPLFEDFM